MRFAMMMTIGVLVGSAHAQPSTAGPVGPGWVLAHQKISDTAAAYLPLGPPTAFGQFLDIRVDGDNGSATGDGSGWGLDAYKYLQDALADAADPPPGVTVRLWVAATNPSNPYRPDRDAANPDGTEDRDSTFLLNSNNVQLLGGFPPGGGDLADRDPALYETVLTGVLRPECGAPNAGNCFQPNGTPGCDNAECCEAVCTVDPECCEVGWDQACADLAFTVCGSCGDQGSGDCFEPNGTPGCEDAACCEIVCGAHPECCNDQWDQACAIFANNVCGACGEPDSGSCFEPNGTPGCEDSGCCAAVCEIDPLCCIEPWSQSCVDLAIDIDCSIPPPSPPPKAYHVVTASFVDDSARIDGFTITNGLADRPGDNGFGAGMFISNASPAVVRVTFTENSAPGRGGGAMRIEGTAHPLVVNCSMTTNDGYSGGAIHISSPLVSATLVNCLISGNTATSFGGGIRAKSSFPATLDLINCTVTDNTAQSSGGGIRVGGSMEVTITNSILWGNLAAGNPDQIDDDGKIVTVRYSDVEGGWGDPMDMNIDDDPLFVDPGNGDYRLSFGSPCIDAGNNWGVPVDENDYDEDGVLCELFPVDLDGNPRFNADEADIDPGCGIPVVVDMGAYEYQFDPVDQVTFADLNGDDAVGVADLLGLLASWGPCAKGCCLADLDLDGAVGVSDLLALLANWGPCP